MTYFKDLSKYSYDRSSPLEQPVKNIGWLGQNVEFATDVPEPVFLELLWQHCLISILQTRGLYECHLCSSRESNVVERDGRQLLLGSAEIRVFSRAGGIYAAPNLIYHYVSVHNYSPPQEFRDAVIGGLRPPSKEYLDRLSVLGVPWAQTLAPGQNTTRVRFVRTPEGVKRVEE
jgi:hypothetical protein